MLAIKVKRGADGLSKRLTDAQKFRIVRYTCADGDEFVTAKPRKQVGLAQAPPKCCGDVLQGRVASRMTVSIIDGLEVIQIDLQHTKAGPSCRIAIKGRFDEGVVFVAICEASQAVVFRHESQRAGRFAQRLLLIDLLGHIAAQ